MPQPISLLRIAATMITNDSRTVPRVRKTETSRFNPTPARKKGTSNSVTPCARSCTLSPTLSERAIPARNAPTMVATPSHTARNERPNNTISARLNCVSPARSFSSILGITRRSVRVPYFATSMVTQLRLRRWLSVLQRVHVLPQGCLQTRAPATRARHRLPPQLESPGWHAPAPDLEKQVLGP